MDVLLSRQLARMELLLGCCDVGEGVVECLGCNVAGGRRRGRGLLLPLAASRAPLEPGKLRLSKMCVAHIGTLSLVIAGALARRRLFLCATLGCRVVGVHRRRAAARAEGSLGAQAGQLRPQRLLGGTRRPRPRRIGRLRLRRLLALLIPSLARSELPVPACSTWNSTPRLKIKL